jgi:hypothetical protein
VRLLLLALALLCACPSTALYSTVVQGLYLQREYTLNSRQICQDAPELLRCGEQIASMLIDQAVAGGHASSRAEAIKRWTRPGLCLIDRWEPCCLDWSDPSSCTRSTPGHEFDPRANCTYDVSTWVARLNREGTAPRDYSADVETELRTSLGQRLGIRVTPQHTSPWDLGPRTGVVCAWKR